MLRSNAPILQKTAERNLVRHPAKLSNILRLKYNELDISRMDHDISMKQSSEIVSQRLHYQRLPFLAEATFKDISWPSFMTK